MRMTSDFVFLEKGMKDRVWNGTEMVLSPMTSLLSRNEWGFKTWGRDSREKESERGKEWNGKGALWHCAQKGTSTSEKERTKRRKGAGEKKKNKAAVDIESSERIATDLTGPSASNIGPPIHWGINISRPRRFYDPRGYLLDSTCSLWSLTGGSGDVSLS